MNPLLLIVLLPLVDIVLLVWIGRHTSLGFALLLVAGGVVAGMALLPCSVCLRRLAALRPAKRSWPRERRPVFAGIGPARRISHFAAGILLILPGVLSDGLAILLLIPWGRRLLGAWLITRACAPVASGSARFFRL